MSCGVGGKSIAGCLPRGIRNDAKLQVMAEKIIKLEDSASYEHLSSLYCTDTAKRFAVLNVI